MLTCVVVLFWACSGGEVPVVMDASKEADQAVEAAGPETVAEAAPDQQPIEVSPDLQPEEGAVACVPGTGCFLDPCTQDSDCLEGPCVEHIGERVCSRPCGDGCPEGFECGKVGEKSVCVSNFQNLCKPCVAASDCAEGGDGACVVYGPGGRFCGGACGPSDYCPKGYVCRDVTTSDGAQTRQCVAESGECPCAKGSVGHETVCYVENEWGRCDGRRTCGEDGLSACDAKTPEKEVCDGIDNDCDGETDEGASCDDGNPCTQDECHGSCVSTPVADGTPCDDKDPCTTSDQCSSGVCKGTPVGCDDGNLCTDDSCGPDGKCVFAPNTADCDDSDPCTVADRCSLGTCAGVPVNCDCESDMDCLKLDDGDLCNGTLFCDKTKVPFRCATVPDSVVKCPPPTGKDAVCLEAKCVPNTGECTFAPAREGLACSDGNACTLDDVCKGGVCEGQKVATCDDHNPCTDDTCLSDTGCLFTPNKAPCDDANACTWGDVCAGGKCIGQKAVDCDDANPCTDDWCDPVAGCQHKFNEAPCDDSNACTLMDRCNGGECLGTSALVCDDGNVCTDDSCDPKKGCIFVPNEAPCDDHNSCTVNDVCKGGECRGSGTLQCDDNNYCTKDICLPDGGCAHEPLEGACSDGDPCTLGDFCSDGKCIPGQPLVCNDNNPCTDDKCKDGACVFAPNSAPCDDGDACTKDDICALGKCSGTKVVCDDNNPCTADWCDPASGCKSVNISDACDDGNPCTIHDVCRLGECVGSDLLDCDDKNPCTDDSCNPLSGCVNKPNTAACTDNNACTEGDQCADGKCVPGTEVDCDDKNVCTLDSCDTSKGCVHTPVASACDDHNACTGDDQCSGGVCVGKAVNCDDGLLCTVDSCDPASGCTHELIKPCCGNAIVEPPEACDDGNNSNEDNCTTLCQLPSCSDTFRNGDESDVDCGGSCPGCPDGGKCAQSADCASLVCSDGVCQVPSCSDSVTNGSETDKDCGGSCPPCPDLSKCNVDKDCQSGVCKGHVCQVPTCNDSVRNGLETDIDCGGGTCPPCGTGKHCQKGSDCASLVCNGGTCAAPTCTDNVKNGNETDVDCGGGTCPQCKDGQGCLVTSDCVAEALCQASKCSIFGTGVDGSLTIASGTTTINTQRSFVNGQTGSNVVTISSSVSGFAAGRRVLLHQTMGQGAGQWEERLIVKRNGASLTLDSPLKNTYVTSGNNRAQIIVIQEYSNVTITGGLLTAPAFDGTTGGIMAFLVTGKLAISGSGRISMDYAGFRGSSHSCFYRCSDGVSGESISGPVGAGGVAPARNGMGGGGGSRGQDCAAGGGGGYGTAGGAGSNGYCGICIKSCPNLGGQGGGVAGLADTSKNILFGGAGGEGGGDEDGGNPGKGGNGGGIIVIKANEIAVTGGGISANGQNGANGDQGACGGWGCGMAGGGGGAGGGMYLVAQTAALGSSLVAANGGTGGLCTCGPSYPGGTGGVGRIAVKATNVTGTTAPPFLKLSF